jgi:hypothetical protein
MSQLPNLVGIDFCAPYFTLGDASTRPGTVINLGPMSILKGSLDKLVEVVSRVR